MAGKNIFSTLITFVLVQLTMVAGYGDFCYEYSDDTGQLTNFKYCEHGCCGYLYSRTCCDGVNAGVIVGAVFGALVFIGLVVAVAVIVYCYKKKGNHGSIIAPSLRNNQMAMTRQSTMMYNNGQQTLVYTGQPSVVQPSVIYTASYPQQPLYNPHVTY